MPPSATITLTRVEGRVKPGAYVFEEPTTRVLGRSTDCSPQLPDDPDHKTVSRHHCLPDINPPDIRIRDFGSLNGTYVNGEKTGQRRRGLTPEETVADSYPEHDLKDGDRIRLGDTVFRVDTTRPQVATPRLARCAKCERELGDEAGRRPGELLCAA
ncbi:FHA domain-containing protein [Streptomyces malaysiensis]|uniref:FHA domain-containing protein n=1 Tax=Streptomyces malaysiensis TaxID=92644 RepID=UPI00371A2EF8